MKEQSFLFDYRDRTMIIQATTEEEAREIYKVRYGIPPLGLLGIIK